MIRAIGWASNKYRPDEGWLALLLLSATIATVCAAVLAVEWVPEDGIVVPASLLGLALAIVLAKRPLPAAAAWILITLYGGLVNVVALAGLTPPLGVLVDGWGSTSQFWRLNMALLIDRVAGWSRAALTGGASEETIVFALGLGLLSWFLSAYAGWATFRQRSPLLGLTAVGVAVAINGYFGNAPVAWAALFVALTALITAAMHYANLESLWTATDVDYSAEIRLDLLMYATAISLMLLGTAVTLPAINIRAISRALLNRPEISQAEETLERVFGGVRQPRRDPIAPGGQRVRGTMPRSYLLGDAPELHETVVMLATVDVVDTGEQVTGEPAVVLRGSHWRGLSYDVYTGRGWALSEERSEILAPAQAIALPEATGQSILRQRVEWLFDSRVIRYTVGLPLQFDQEITVLWRGLDDLSRVQGDGTEYSALSRLTTADAQSLRRADVAQVPATILARYTALPDSVPERVRQLALEVADKSPTAYDQALSLEQFLRQYPYSLDVSLPASDEDPVEFFLFELQRGYCDYYASSMVVMARSLGLPARLATGFLAQPPDENGVQTIRQISAHSWPEIYFAGYGWVEFEPTAAFSSARRDASANNTAELSEDPQIGAGELPPPPIPEADEPAVGTWDWLRFVLLTALLAGLWGWRWRQQQRRAHLDTVLWAYHQLQRHARRLGTPVRASQTPHEFTDDLLASLETTEVPATFLEKRRHEVVAQLQPAVRRLAELFVNRQYGDRAGVGTAAAHDLWLRMRPSLWLLQFLHRVAGRGQSN